MIFCPNKNDKDFKELQAVVGKAATAIWSENNGNPIHLNKEGKPSKLFNDLLEITGNRKKAIEIKAKTFTEQFKNWYKGAGEPTVTNSSFTNKLGETKSIYNSGTFSSIGESSHRENLKDSQEVNSEVELKFNPKGEVLAPNGKVMKILENNFVEIFKQLHRQRLIEEDCK